MAGKQYRPAPRRVIRPQSGRESTVQAETVLQAARQVACKVVAEHWPELAAVEPTVTPWHGSAPSPRLMAQLGLAEAAAAAQPMQLPAYTFTFMAETRSPEGYPVAQVARVTVDSQQRVLKATVTK